MHHGTACASWCCWEVEDVNRTLRAAYPHSRFVIATSAPLTTTPNGASGGRHVTAADDYIAQTGSLRFNPGETIKTITVAVRGDRKLEFGEMFFVNLSNVSGGFSSDWSGVGLIRNDDK